MRIIRASFLNSFRTCPRRCFQTKSNFDPTATFLGTIVHAAARGIDCSRFLKYYSKEVKYDLVLMKIIEKLSTKAYERRQETKEKSVKRDEEVGMIAKYNDDYWIEGTADVIYKLETDGPKSIIRGEDYKTCAQLSKYEKESIREQNAQHYVYPWLAMKYYNADECVFTYRALEKKNSARMKGYSITVTMEEAESKVTEIMEDYIFTQETEIYDERLNDLCFKFCPLKGQCSAYKKKYFNNN